MEQAGNDVNFNRLLDGDDFIGDDVILLESTDELLFGLLLSQGLISYSLISLTF